MTLSTKEIYTHYQIEQAERELAGFKNAARLAIEDTAWLLDLSIKDVCVAIAKEEGGKKDANTTSRPDTNSNA